MMAAFAATAAWADCKLEQLAQLPVTMEGPRPLVHAKINGQDQQFLADSGAFFSVISQARAKELGLSLHAAPYGVTLHGVGGAASIQTGVAKTFTLAGTEFPRAEFIVGGAEVDDMAVGVMGENVLGAFDAEFDLGQGMIKIMRSKGCSHSNLAYWASASTPISVVAIKPRDQANGQIRGEADLDGVSIQVVFDTGSSTSMLSVGAARRARAVAGQPGVTPAGSVRGFGNAFVRTWTAPFKDFSLGGEQIKMTRLRFGDMSLGGADMLLGADFFLSHHVYVDNADHKLFFTYNGGPVFDLRTHDEGTLQADDQLGVAKIASEKASAGAPNPSLKAPSDPVDADGFSRRGAARAARADHQGADADFTRAMALDPKSALYVYQRAQVRFEEKKTPLAVADLDTVISMDPKHVLARLQRASLRIADHDPEGAKADVDEAAAASAPQSDLNLTIAELYSQLDAFAASVAKFDAWIDAHPDDPRLAAALNGRCWARALGNLAPEKAVADCNAALRLAPKSPAVLDSRGLAELRKGDLDRAAADYNAALAANGKLAWSLYGRSVVNARKGRKAAATADLAAATAAAPDVPVRAKKLGLAP